MKKLVAFKTKTKIYKILKYFHKLIMIRSCHDVSTYGLEKYNIHLCTQHLVHRTNKFVKYDF